MRSATYPSLEVTDDQPRAEQPINSCDCPYSTDTVNSQQVNIYGHSTLLYWWPAWAFGFVVGLLNVSVTGSTCQDTFCAWLELYIDAVTTRYFTNVRLRGIKSVVVILAVGFVAVLLAWLGWWDEIVSLIP